MTAEINALLQVLLRVENVARHVGSFCRKAHVENALFACIHLVIVLNMEYIKTKVTELNTKRQIIINFFQIEKSLSYFHIAHTHTHNYEDNFTINQICLGCADRRKEEKKLVQTVNTNEI